MAISEEKLHSILKTNFPNAQLKIIDLAQDQDHYALEITCESFKDLPLIKQHRMVKSALSDVLHKELHAITIKTKTP